MLRPEGYIAPIVVVTAGYALFQTANNTAVMTDISPDRRGVISGMLNLSRNLGLITGASVMGAVFAFASATTDITTARPEAPPVTGRVRPEADIRSGWLIGSRGGSMVDSTRQSMAKS